MCEKVAIYGNQNPALFFKIFLHRLILYPRSSIQILSDWELQSSIYCNMDMSLNVGTTEKYITCTVIHEHSPDILMHTLHEVHISC